jgi:tRNA U55 pseudouridine synthase TruB
MSLNGLFAIRKPVGPSSAQVLNAIQDLLRKSPHFQDHMRPNSAPGKRRTKRQRLTEGKVKVQSPSIFIG